MSGFRSHIMLQLHKFASSGGHWQAKSAAVEAHRRMKREENARVLCVEVWGVCLCFILREVPTGMPSVKAPSHTHLVSILSFLE